MGTIAIQVKQGPNTFVIDLTANSTTLRQLQEAIETATGVMARKQKLLHKGKVLTSLPPATTLEAAGVVSGSKLMLIATAGAAAPTQGAAALQAAHRAKAEALKARLASKPAAPPPAPPAGAMEARAAAWKKTGIASLRDLKLNELPAELWACGDLRVADLGGNRLTAVPPSLGSLARLQKLRLSLNALTDAGIPWDAMASLTHLVVLALDHNALTTLPPSLGALTNLQKLTVDHNRITELSEELGNLTALRALSAGANALTALPASLGRCVALEELDASKNAISEIPEAFSTLTSLRTLHLTDNKVKAVPTAVLTGARSLATLTLHGCPITMEELRGTEGFSEFEARRVAKYDKQVDMKVLGQGGGFTDAADVYEWEHWGKKG
jgi:Leucine-rich repeat (LRR) protein